MRNVLIWINKSPFSLLSYHPTCFEENKRRGLSEDMNEEIEL